MWLTQSITAVSLAAWSEHLPSEALIFEGGRPLINLSALMNEQIADLDYLCVVDALNTLHRAAFKAQEKANASLPLGSKLNAFQSAYTVGMNSISITATISGEAQIADNLIGVKGRSI